MRLGDKGVYVTRQRITTTAAAGSGETGRDAVRGPLMVHSPAERRLPRHNAGTRRTNLRVFLPEYIKKEKVRCAKKEMP